MTSRVVAIRFAVLALTTIALAFIASCTIAFEPRCRGDSTPATADTSLIRCATLDSLVAKQ